MENEENQNQQSDEWQGGLEPRTEVKIDEAPVEVTLTPGAPAKDPNTTPTAELVADYEALLAEIRSRKANHDDNLASLDAMRAEAIAAYEQHVKGASVEAAKLLVVISKRLGMPLNGLQAAESQSLSQQRRIAAQTQPTETRSHHAQRGGQQTRWCEKCGMAIHVKGWAAHQGAHQRHGNVLPRKQFPSGDRHRKFSQSMSEDKCRELLTQLRKYQPISSKEFSLRLNKPNLSAFMTGLKQRGYAANDDAKWTVTPKGAALIA
jgi:hypothetical protein